jgi:hypothetical protein
MRERFPDWERHTQYWRIGDVGFMTPERALSAIDEQIDKLLAALGAAGTSRA